MSDASLGLTNAKAPKRERRWALQHGPKAAAHRRRHSSPAGNSAFRRANGLSEESSGGMAPERKI